MESLLRLCLLVAACGGTSPAPVAPPTVQTRATAATCDQVRAPFERRGARLRAAAESTRTPMVVAAAERLAPAYPPAAFTACTADRWSPDQIGCFVRAPSDDQVDACIDGLGPALRASFDLYLDAAAAPMPAGPAEGGSLARDTTVIDCDEYLRLFDAYLACERIPRGARDAARPLYEATAANLATLADPSTPPDRRATLTAVCRAQHQALLKSAVRVGCPR